MACTVNPLSLGQCEIAQVWVILKYMNDIDWCQIITQISQYEQYAYFYISCSYATYIKHIYSNINCYNCPCD